MIYFFSCGPGTLFLFSLTVDGIDMCYQADIVHFAKQILLYLSIVLSSLEPYGEVAPPQENDEREQSCDEKEQKSEQLLLVRTKSEQVCPQFLACKATSKLR